MQGHKPHSSLNTCTASWRGGFTGETERGERVSIYPKLLSIIQRGWLNYETDPQVKLDQNFVVLFPTIQQMEAHISSKKMKELRFLAYLSKVCVNEWL